MRRDDSFLFPPIKTTRTQDERIQKVYDEIQEFLEARESGDSRHADEEMIDILQTVETLVRGHFEGRDEMLKATIAFVFQKCDGKGYYSKDCF